MAQQSHQASHRPSHRPGHQPGQHDGHQHEHHHDGGKTEHGAGLAELLDLDAEVFGSFPDEATEWVEQHAPVATGTVVDLGAGTGTGSLALARRFEAAEVIAIDRSPLMLDRIRAAADRYGLAGRLRAVPADVDVAWPAVGTADVVWAASSLHEVADPDRVLRDVYAALNPGGLLVVIELDALPRFLPDDLGQGRRSPESRWHDALARAGWNAHPDWTPHLERAGFELAAERRFVLTATPESPSVARYADAFLRRIRAALDGQLDSGDRDAIDRLLAADSADALLRRNDLNVRASRTAWAARRP